MLKKLSLILLLTCSMFSLQANGGFREALSALQHKDAELMLTEVEKAVKAKNYDGVYLFVPTLSYWYFKGEFVPKNIKDEAIAKLALVKKGSYADIYVDASWESFLNQSQQGRLATSLGEVDHLDFPYQETLRQLLLALPRDYQAPIDEKTQRVKEQYEAFQNAERHSENTIDTKNMTHQDRLAIIERAASLGNIRYQVLLAELQIGEQKNIYGFDGLAKSNIVKINKELGYKQLEDIAKNSDIHWLGVDGICLVGDAYRDGLFGREKSDKEAYLWYLRGFVRGHGAGDTCVDKMQLAHKQGWIELYNINNVKNIHSYNNWVNFSKFNETQQPKAILEHQANQKLPVLQIDENLPNYRLRVYKDGWVEYATIREYDGYETVSWFYPKKTKIHAGRLNSPNIIQGKYEWKVSRNKVKSLIDSLEKLNLNDIPSHSYEVCLCDGGETQTETKVSVRTNKSDKWMSFNSWMLRREPNFKWGKKIFPVEAGVKTIIEKHIPTQALRCVDKVLGEQYLACIDTDKKIEIDGNEWLARQKAKK